MLCTTATEQPPTASLTVSERPSRTARGPCRLSLSTARHMAGWEGKFGQEQQKLERNT
ncbi:hypothetical protein E2C01_088058 [Portunus trituberculatus]|uniref:Uncharacterized protein n=1 Tax=Portunus trituberculatus TaxID=210409 RepID=A0A5B7JED1_PORTR|nr:hypothetical protein [Portunus trituberculatus]